MPNSAKKTLLPKETSAAPKTEMEAEMDDCDFASLDELATFMVDALTIPMPTDFHKPKDPAADIDQEPVRHPTKKLN